MFAREVTIDSILKDFSFSHIQNYPFFIKILINPRRFGQCGKYLLYVWSYFGHFANLTKATRN